MSEKVNKLREKPHWSFSSLNEFINICLLQWAFRYIYQLESESTSVNLVFGSAFHKTATVILRQKNTFPTSKEVQEAFSENWKLECKAAEILKLESCEWDQLNTTDRKMIECLNNEWLEKDIVAVNQEFSVPLLGISKPLVGEIDLIVRDDSRSMVIVDWKTSERKWVLL